MHVRCIGDAVWNFLSHSVKRHKMFITGGVGCGCGGGGCRGGSYTKILSSESELHITASGEISLW